MASILDPHLAEIAELCHRYGVRRLELFGSATTDAFDPRTSDFDFLLDFKASPSNLFDRYFGLKESLEALYGREVDLVDRRAVESSENYIRRRHILSTAEAIHVAG